MKTPLTVLCFCYFACFSFSQRNVFVWGEGLTEYTGIFDTTQFKPEEIRNIYHYLCQREEKLMTVGHLWKMEQMDTATTQPIDDYYFNTLRTLDRMKIPESSFWDSLRMYRKKELFEICQDQRLFILAIKNPAILNDFYQEACADEIKALTGDSTQLLQAWFELKEKQKLTNGSPENLEKRYQKAYQSKDRLKYARYELMTYGWGNCMNRFVYYHSDEERIEREFEKLFIQVKKEEFED